MFFGWRCRRAATTRPPEEIDPSETAAENIRRLCFSPKGVLREDFDEMFADVITKAPMLASRVLRSLVDGPKSVSEIAAALGTAKGGRFSDVLAQLIESGMVASDTGKNPVTNRDMRETRYRIKDNYSVFYLKYVEPVKDAIDKNSFPFGSLDSLDGWDSLMGLAFENLVLSNLRPLLGLQGRRDHPNRACLRGPSRTDRGGRRIFQFRGSV